MFLLVLLPDVDLVTYLRIYVFTYLRIYASHKLQYFLLDAMGFDSLLRVDIGDA
jgi:hypothetical protein